MSDSVTALWRDQERHALNFLLKGENSQQLCSLHLRVRHKQLLKGSYDAHFPQVDIIL